MSDDDRVQLVGPEPVGFAHMLAAIAQGNLEQHPERAAHLDGKPGVIRITVVDAEVVVALEFRDGRLRIYSGERSAPPDVEIIADSEFLTTRAPQLGPLPHPFKAEGRAALRKLLKGDAKIKGAVRHGKLLRRMQGLMDVGE